MIAAAQGGAQLQKSLFASEQDRPHCDRIDAPCVLDGPINGQFFTAYVEQFLVPTLSPGDIVIMDNLGSHKGQAMRKAIRSDGSKLLFLPSYSPDLNPIEQVFAKLKPLLRKTAERSLPAKQMRQLHQKQRICRNLARIVSS